MNILSSMLKFLIDEIGGVALPTVAQTITGAISELYTTISQIKTKQDNTHIVFVNAPLGQLTFNAPGAAGGTISVAQYIPTGYTMIGAIPATSGYFGAYFYTCYAASATSVYVQLLRISGTQASTSPLVKLLCTKNL